LNTLRNAADYLEKLKPIVIALNQAQSDRTMIADIVNAWLNKNSQNAVLCASLPITSSPIYLSLPTAE